MFGHAGNQTTRAVENAQQDEGLFQIGLIGQDDKVIAHAVQDGATDGEIRLELQYLVRELDHRACDRARLRGDLELVSPAPADRERTAHPDERGERRDVAVRTLGDAARELVANLCRKGHLPHHLRERSGKAPDIMDGWGFSTREISYDDAPS